MITLIPSDATKNQVRRARQSRTEQVAASCLSEPPSVQPNVLLAPAGVPPIISSRHGLARSISVTVEIDI